MCLRKGKMSAATAVRNSKALVDNRVSPIQCTMQCNNGPHSHRKGLWRGSNSSGRKHPILNCTHFSYKGLERERGAARVVVRSAAEVDNPRRKGEARGGTGDVGRERGARGSGRRRQVGSVSRHLRQHGEKASNQSVHPHRRTAIGAI